MHYKVWNVLTCPFQNFHGATVEGSSDVNKGGPLSQIFDIRMQYELQNPFLITFIVS